jgi:beta-N-acetylhexosaminidase
VPDLAALARSVIAVGFEGARAADAPLAQLRAFGPGAIVLFGRNVGSASDFTDLVAAARAIAEPAPLIAVDQEGGRVARLGDALVAPLPAAMAVGASGDPALCETLGLLAGRDLARCGISVDFAPVADLALVPANTVIGSRAFGDDPHAVARFAAAFARGLERGGVAAALKHFPGHGDTAIDSHLALPHVTASAALLRSRDLVPFAASIAEEAASIVMTAHVLVDAFDAQRPATLAPAVISGLLRDELGFDGVVCTDALEMDAIASTVGACAGAVAALAAGADLLLIVHDLATARDAAAAIVAAVSDGTLPRSRLEEAVRRVGALRERYAVPAPFGGAVDAAAPLAAARRAVTRIRGDLRLRADRPVTVISFEGASFDGAGGERSEIPTLSAALRARRWKSEVWRVPAAPDPDDIDLLLAQLPSLGDRNVVFTTRRAHLIPAQRTAVERLLGASPDAIVIAAREPYDALLWPAARNVGCIYGDEEISLAGCADVLAGRADPVGRLPVHLSDAAVS